MVIKTCCVKLELTLRYQPELFKNKNIQLILYIRNTYNINTYYFSSYLSTYFKNILCKVTDLKKTECWT